MSYSLYGDDLVADIYKKQKNPCNTLRPELLCPLHTHTEYIKKKSLIALIQIGLHGEVVQFSKLFHFIQIIMIQVAQANFRGPFLILQDMKEQTEN